MMGIADARPLGAPEIASPTALPDLHVQVTGVSLGFARWYAFDHGQPIVDLVPTYRFRTRLAQGGGYDIELLALEPTAIEFTNPNPVRHPVPVGIPTPAPLAAPALLSLTPRSAPVRAGRRSNRVAGSADDRACSVVPRVHPISDPRAAAGPASVRTASSRRGHPLVAPSQRESRRRRRSTWLPGMHRRDRNASTR
jgi:hypothetical protein